MNQIEVINQITERHDDMHLLQQIMLVLIIAIIIFYIAKKISAYVKSMLNKKIAKQVLASNTNLNKV